jgi:phenylalanyl-tRNA synthetase alpha chain
MAEKSLAADVEAGLLAHLNSTGEVSDSRSFASSLGVSHLELESVIKSLSAFRIVDSTVSPFPSCQPPNIQDLSPIP